MLTFKAPISEIIIYAHFNDVLGISSEVKSEIARFIDTVIYRVQELPINEAAHATKDACFELRAGLLKSYLHNDNLRTIDESINSYISDRIQSGGQEMKLEMVVRDTLAAYQKISLSLVHNAAIRVEEPSLPPEAELPTYTELSNLVHQYPVHNLESFKKWIDASLTFDFAILTAELLLRKKVSLPKSKVQATIRLLYNSMEDFGVYSALLKLWQPSESDETQVIRNIKIRLGAIEAQGHTSLSYELNELKSIFTG